MGRLLLVWRLAMKDIRHRPALTVLMLLVIAAGVATLALGLALRGTTDNPYARTRAATNGPDVVATDINGDPQAAAQPGDLAPLEHAPGVAAHSGPFPITWASLQTRHTTATAEVEGRSSAPSAVDRPKLTQGGWVRPGGVVVEATFAQALGLHVGDRVRLGGSSFEVVGTAATAAFPTYPVAGALGSFLVGSSGTNSIGLVWVPEADVAHLAAASAEPVFFHMDLKLADSAAAPAFANRYDSSPPGSSTTGAAPSGADTTSPITLTLNSWQSIRGKDTLVTARAQLVLVTGSWLLVLLAIASVIVLVGGRMAEQTRRVGLLKAIGGTPRLVAVVLLFEYALVGLCAAGLGLLAGWLAAPLVDRPGAGLLGAPSAPSLTVSTVALAVALALGVALAATFVPAVRAARQSTVAALEDAARVPRRRARVIALSAHLPAPLLLGVRLAFRRPARLLLSVFSVAVTTSGLVAVLILHQTVSGVLGPVVSQATTTITLMLVLLAAANAVFIAWTTALETRQPAAVARALGATPRQVATGLSVALMLPALLGALLGIAGGIGLHHAAKEAGPTPVPPGLWLAALVVATLLVIAVLTAVPLSIDARRPVAEVLQSETT
jgi:putative ABC transport system permease protein